RSAQLIEPFLWIATTLQHFHQRRTDYNSVHMPAQTLNLLPAADPKAGADRDSCQRADAIKIADHFFRYGYVLASRARHGDCIHEALAAFAELSHPLRPGDGGDHLHHGNPL